MAQPNANREPTMEEILASIRRIIESNDAGATDNARPADAAEFAETRETDLNPVTKPSLAAAETVGSGFSRPPAIGAGDTLSDSRPVSLADVAARVRASGGAAPYTAGRSMPAAPALSTRGNAAVRVDPHFDESVDEHAWVADDEDDDATEPAEQVAANDRGMAVHAESPIPSHPSADDVRKDDAGLESSLHDALSAAVEPEVRKAAAEPEPGESASEPAWQKNETAAEGVAGEAKAGTHLMSASSGAKVAAAFGDLSDVFSAGPQRSFDEMAEEMLRPMLQQWLDDNLPTLVERLVREEIERVARGSRR